MARRLNTKFLTILLLTFVGLVAAALFAEHFLIHDHPDHYIALGDEDMKDHNWQDAAVNYTKASNLDPHNPETDMRLGKAYEELAQFNPQALAAEIAAYSQALEINPNYLPALQALADVYLKQASSNPTASYFRNAIDYSHRAYAADPTDKQMEIQADRLVMQAWSGGLEADQNEVDAAIKEMKDLWAKDPASADLALAIATSEAQKGSILAAQLGATEQPKEVTDHYHNAVAIFESVLTGPNASQAGNALMHSSFARILESLSSLDQSSPGNTKMYQARAAAESARAMSLTKPGQPDYNEIYQYAAALALHNNDREGALKIYAQMPDTPDVRLQRADLLGRSPETQEKALEILRNTLGSLSDDPNHIALGGVRFGAMLEMAEIDVFRYLVMPASDQKTKLRADIHALLDKLDSVAGFRIIYPLKEVEARFQLGSGGDDEMAGIQNLSKLMADNPPPKKDGYWYVFENLLAQGYEDTNQTANAMSILKDVVDEYPKDIPARSHLIRLMIVEQPDQAAAQIAELATLDPDNPDLNLFHIQLLLSDPEKNRDKIQRIYAALGESTPRQCTVKAKVAMLTQNDEEAVRLLRLSLAKDPSNSDNWVMLTQILFKLGRKDQSLDAAQRGLAAIPSDIRLRLMIPGIKGENSKVIENMQIDMAKANPDKVQGELILAALASKHGDDGATEAHLKAAEKLAPDSPRVQDLLFNLYLKTNRFDKAAACLPILVKADADHAGGDLYRLALAMARKDNASAESIARKLTVEKPEFARTWLALGDVLQAEGLYDQAVPQYLVAKQKESNLDEAYIGLAKCYYALRKPDDALQAIEEGLRRLPTDPTLMQMHLTHELNYGQPAEAVKEIQAELAARPDQPELYAAMADVLLRYAGILRANNQPDDALKQIQEAIQVLKPQIAKWPNEPELYTALATCQFAAKQPDDALQTLNNWAEQPQWRIQPGPYIALSNFYDRVGMPDKSEEEMHDAMARSGYRYDLQIQMASLLAMHKKYDDAIALLREVNADQPEVREKLITILLVANRFNDAQAEFKADLSRNPPNAESLLTLWALALFERGMYQDAIDRSTQALAYTPTDPTPLFCRGRARLRVQPPDPAGALQDLELVRQSSPNNLDVRFYLADAHMLLNQQDAAEKELEAGLRIDSQNKDIRMRLVRLYSSGSHPRYSEALRLLQDVDSAPPFNKDPDIFQGEAVLFDHTNDLPDALAKSEIALGLAPDNEAIVRTNLELLKRTQNFQAVVDHYTALNPKFKSTSWALWDVALAEKNLNSSQALPDLNRALQAAANEGQSIELDAIARSIYTQFGFDEAIKDVAAISQNSVTAQISLAQLYQTHGDSSQALATMDGIMDGIDKLRPNDQVNVLGTAAIMYQVAKPNPRVDKAYNAYKRWLAIEPNNLEALNNMACLLADDYSPPRAQEGLQYANRAVARMSELGRTEPRLLDTQAWLLILSGSAPDGIHILNTIINDFAPFPDEYLHLGEGYLKMDNPDPVQAELQAKVGLQMIKKQDAADQDDQLRAKLEDLVNRSEELRKAGQQAQAP